MVMSKTNRESSTQQEIAERAYEIYLERGSQNGRDVEDWLAAEKEFERPSGSATKTKAAAAGRES
jgi:hypothetical protein